MTSSILLPRDDHSQQVKAAPWGVCTKKKSEDQEEQNFKLPRRNTRMLAIICSRPVARQSMVFCTTANCCNAEWVRPCGKVSVCLCFFVGCLVWWFQCLPLTLRLATHRLIALLFPPMQCESRWISPAMCNSSTAYYDNHGFSNCCATIMPCSKAACSMC